MLLVHGESQVQQLQLAVVPVEEIPAGGTVLARTSHVLAQSAEGRAFLGVPLRVIAVRVLDIVLEGPDPVDLVGGLERHRYHGHLRHVGDLDGVAQDGLLMEARGLP